MTDDDVLRCSFCTKSQRVVAKLIAGPDVYICGEDVARAEQERRDALPDEKCSFCGKTELDWVYAHPGVIICSACVKLCLEIIEEDPTEHVGKKVEVEIAPPSSEIGTVVGARCSSCHGVLAETARAARRGSARRRPRERARDVPVLLGMRPHDRRRDPAERIARGRPCREERVADMLRPG